MKKKAKAEEETKEKEKNSNKKRNIIIIIVVIIVSLICMLAFYLVNKNSKVDWGKEYLNILEDSSKIDNMKNMKVGLIDIDNNKTPELIITGESKDKKEIEIYNINKDKKVDITKVKTKEPSLEYDYNIKTNKYNWYVNNDKNVYSIDLENTKTKKENLNYDEDIIKVASTDDKMVDYSKGLSKDKIEKVLQNAEKKYSTNSKLVSKDIKSKIEDAKALKSVKKVDKEKDLVYTYVTKTYRNNTYEYPHINIDSTDAKSINDALDKKYSFISNIDDGSPIEIAEVSYKYYINGSILSVIVWNGGNSSIEADTYNIDLKTLKSISGEEILKKYKLNKDDVINKSYDKLKAEYESTIKKEKAKVEASNYQSYFDKWPTELKPNVEKLNLYINDKNEIILLAEYHHLGGQEYCTQTVEINISNNYSLSELSYKNGRTNKEMIEEQEKVLEEQKKKEEEEKKKQEEANKQTSTASKTTSTSSQSTSDLTKDQIKAKLQKVYGTDIGYLDAGTVTEGGANYYVFDLKMLVGGGVSELTMVEAKADGTVYREIDNTDYNNSKKITPLNDFKSY